MKKIAMIFCVLLLLYGCSNKPDTPQQPDTNSSDTPNTESTENSTSPTVTVAVDETIKEESADWQSNHPISIQLTGNSAQCADSTVMIQEGIITITKGATYVLSGTLQDGGIVVNAPDEDVWLVLNGVTITHKDGSAIWIQSAKNTLITLATNSENVLSDQNSYADEECTAVIYSQDDLTFNGTGLLTVNAQVNNAIQSKDDLVFLNGNYTITSTDDGIVGKDSVRIADGTFTIQTEDDAIRSTNEEEDNRGYILINGGTFTIDAGSDAIQAATVLLINKGDFILTCGKNRSSTSSYDSAKGLKAALLLELRDGNYTIDSADDCLHSNGDITINGGTFTLSSQDDAVHADDALTILNGTITIPASYEGLEGNMITIAGGVIDLVATDDGINGAGGIDSMQGGWNRNPDRFSNTSSSLTITGGKIIVDAAGDGIDVNGSFTMSGGEVIVYGPTDNGNGALDYDGSFTIDGGTLIALGSSGMAQTPSSASSQSSIAVTLNGKAGDVIALYEGEEIIATVTSKKSYSSFICSVSALQTDTTYRLTVNNETFQEFTLSGIVTYLNSQGATNNMQGFGDKGAQPGQPGRRQ